MSRVTTFGTLLSLLIGISLGFFGGGGSILTVPLMVSVFYAGYENRDRVLVASGRRAKFDSSGTTSASG